MIKPSPKTTVKSIRLTRQSALTLKDNSLINRDCEIALNDLKQSSHFHPIGDDKGPYEIELYIEDNRLIFHIQNSKKKDLPYLILSLTPYRRLIKDYFMIVNSYDKAMHEGKPSHIEAIDMGRRALHNEGAELLQERLSNKIELDIDTSRRLFTLICVLHGNKTHILR